MRKLRFLAFMILACTVVACSLRAPASATTSGRKSGTIRVGLSGTSNMRNVPLLMALDALKVQGYSVEVTTFAKTELAQTAMINGDTDIVAANVNNVATLVSKGADIRSIVGSTNMSFYLVVKQAIKSCRDLNGRPLAFSNRQSIGYIMFAKYMKDNCPDVAPQIVLIPDSPNRLAAMLTGEIDGAYLEVDDWLQLQRQAPGKLQILIDFVKVLPNMQVFTFGVRREWAQQHPEMVKDFIRELLLAERRVLGSQELLGDESVKRLELDKAAAQEGSQAYISLGMWDVNGGLAMEKVKNAMDVLAEAASVPQGVKAEDILDLSYLNAVLDEIGRK